MIPCDPTRQKYTNDLSRGDIDVDKARRQAIREQQDYEAVIDRDRQDRLEAQAKGGPPYPSGTPIADALDKLFEQKRDRQQMAEAEVNTARDLIHAYGDARVGAHVNWPDKRDPAVAADAFAKLMVLVRRLADA